ncbi:cytochrome c [Salinimicrobium gaetbulicola]|uniref:Cytochrome c n=1 Tax=Salinimicrobium gaetbulicola TaxID=999702 RepID=A0ABW3IC99_9FLAO
MKLTLKILSALLILMTIACGGKEEKEKETIKLSDNEPKEKVVTEQPATKASEKVDLENKGIGPITDLTLPSTIDQTMAARGQEIFKNMCTACHKTDKKFIGPKMVGVTERRTPEWIMNMILNPEVMVQKDPLAKELLIEHNGSPMANQNLTEEEARAVLEYFRTLKE